MVRVRTQTLKLIAYTLLIAAYLLHIFWQAASLGYIVGLLAIGCIILSFRDANRLFQVIGSLFLVAGFFFYLQTDIPWWQIPSYMTSTILILALLYVLPFINSAFKIGRYDQHINKLLKMRVTHLGQLYFRSSLTTYLLSIFLFFAALPLVHEVIEKNISHLNEKIRHRFASQSILRGFAMAASWSPIHSIVITGAHLYWISPVCDD